MTEFPRSVHHVCLCVCVCVCLSVCLSVCLVCLCMCVDLGTPDRVAESLGRVSSYYLYVTVRDVCFVVAFVCGQEVPCVASFGMLF